jgi:Lrp/AsnC family leucine-responsive transcriptional regulator
VTAETLDNTDWRLLEELQRDGRASVADLARRISMSASAVSARMRRLEEVGVITGYTAHVDTSRLGVDIVAFVRLRHPNANYKPLYDFLAAAPQILEAHHVTGDECWVLKVAARSMPDLESVTGKLATYGAITTTIVYSSLYEGRPITRDLLLGLNAEPAGG